MEQHDTPMTPEAAAALADRLNFAHQFRVRYPVNEAIYPDILDRWWHWYQRELIAAWRRSEPETCRILKAAASGIFDCISLRDASAFGKLIRYEQFVEAVWVASRALDDVELAMPEFAPPRQHTELRKALGALVESPPAPRKKPRRTRKERPNP